MLFVLYGFKKPHAPVFQDDPSMNARVLRLWSPLSIESIQPLSSSIRNKFFGLEVRKMYV